MPTSLQRKKIAGLILALAGGHALALGLGEASGQAVLGQPLRVEIPLLGGGSPPAASCFRVRAPVADIGSDYALRNGRIQVISERGSAKLIVTSPNLVREPFVGFAVAAGCGFELTKDYVLMSAFPTDAQAEVTLPQPAAKPAAAPIVAAPPKTNKPANEAILRVATDTSLYALAQQKYPLQPKAREKFMRMMTWANPAVKSNEDSIAAGTELQIPPGLPQRRTGPYLGEGKPVAQPAAATAPAETPVPAATAAKPAPPSKDRLILGKGQELSEAKLMAEAERLAAVLQEQTKNQEAVAESLTKLESSYAELQQRYGQLESHLNHIEAERLAEKQAPKPASFDFIELLLAVAAGGAVGGLLLHGYQRLRSGREAEPVPTAASSTAIFGFALPWPKPKTPAPEIVAAAPAVVVAAGADRVSKTIEETPTPAQQPAVPEFLRKEAVVAAIPVAPGPAPEEADALSLSFALQPEPETPVPEAVTAPAPAIAAHIESAAADQEAISLDFPLDIPDEAVSTEPEPPVAPDFELPAATEVVSPEFVDLDFPMIPETAKAEEPALLLPVLEEAEGKDVAPALPPGQETLVLDFPEIPTADQPQREENPHVIEFVSTATPEKA